MMKMKKVIATILVCSLVVSCAFSRRTKAAKKGSASSASGTEKNEKKSESSWAETDATVTDELAIWRKAYPDVKFELKTDDDKQWIISVTSYGKTQEYYWADGLYLYKSDLESKEKYWRVITRYQNKILDPATFTPEMTEKIRQFGSSENRKNGKVSSKAIFNAIYDATTRRTTEQHIKQLKFLGYYPNVHEYLHPKLHRIEKRIYALSEKNPEVKKFLAELGSVEAYNWREIRDSNTRSFHSYGIAIDILPRGWGKKIVYWGFEKANGNADWMLIPVSKRWMPPKEVIDIFEDEGFIWGGYWAVWDNMHFEYHPELVLNKEK